MRIKTLGPAPVDFGLQSLEEVIVELLSSAKGGGEFYAITAYAQASGIKKINSSVERLVKSGGLAQVVVGIDDRGTSSEALDMLIKTLGVGNVFVFHNPADATFHPKVYLIRNEVGKAIAVFGSSNLTAGGLANNFEANLAIELDLSQEGDMNLWMMFHKYFESIRDAPSSRPLTEDLKKELENQGYVTSEQQTVRQTRQGQRTRLSLFPSMKVRRRVRKPQKAPTPIRGFVMTLSRNDVSAKRSEPYILIPIAARDANPSFWGWSGAYSRTPRGGHLERRFTLKVKIPGKKPSSEKGRLYMHDGKKEFRLRCSAIHQLGPGYVGSVVKITWKHQASTQVCQVELVPVGFRKYESLLSKCRKPASKQKSWGYI